MTRPRVMFATLVLTLIICACSSMATPEPTAKRPSTPTPTATSVATDTAELIEGNYFVPHPNNPVLTGGAPESWDAETVFSAHVVLEDGLYHMFYNGSSDPTLPSVAIGYAASSDGQSFTRPASSPILEADGSGFDARQVSTGVPLVEEDVWVLYYNAGGGPGPGRSVGRATASEPAGPWTRDTNPVLVIGGPGEWDAGFIIPDSIVATNEGYVMYYSGGSGWPEGTTMIGMATSSDGVTWIKYDDPSTTDPPFAESDPVLSSGPTDSWDSASVWACAAIKTATGWEMFYTGGDATKVQIGYATSGDGIHWTKHTDNPILSPDTDPVAARAALPILQSPSVVVEDSTYVLYYDYGVSTGSIGVAVGAIPR